MPKPYRAAVVTVSDGVSQGTREDASGDLAAGVLADAGFDVAERRVVADERADIEGVLSTLGEAGIELVVTTGGTGFGPRDVTPEATKAVIEVIAKRGLVLATGHVSSVEGLMLLREGKRQGVRHMVVTHAMNAPILMTVPQMQEAASLGAFIEFVGGSMRLPDAPATVQRYADAIRTVGPAFCILSSDLGQKGNPLPADGFAEFVAALRERRFTDVELTRMTKQNPATLLGLQ
jgi:molybdenum cofactor synthesis domain-containing protein